VAIEGSWFITRAALEDYARLTGKVVADPDLVRPALLAEISRAHFVKQQDSGAELWRGGKPLRLRFIVVTEAGVGGGAPQLVRVEGDHRGRSVSAPRSRRVRVWDGATTRELEITDEIHDPSPERRVAYRLATGQWVTGQRGRTRPDEVRDLTPPRQNVPDWVQQLRGSRERRGGRGR
jgi:hypothetical protein